MVMFVMKNMLLYRKSLLPVCLLFMSAICFGQVTEKWVKRQNGDANTPDVANSLVVDHKNNVIVTGGSEGEGTGSDYTTIKYDGDGNKVWVKRYNGPGNGDDEAVATAVDQKGNVYVTGWSTGKGSGRDYTTIKYNDDGDTKWVRRFNGPGNGFDEAVAITIDEHDNVYVTGRSTGTGSGIDYTTIKYDDDGDTKWIKRYAGSNDGFNRATAITVDKDCNVYVTGSSNGDYATIKYDKEGNTKWVQKYNGPAGGLDRADAVTVDDYGNVFVTGIIITFLSDDEDDVNADAATLKYNAQGVQQWVAIYDRLGADDGKAIAVDNAGNVFITVNSGAPDETFFSSFSTIKYNASGIQQWATQVSPTGTGSEAEVHGLALDQAGNVFVTGAVANDYLNYVTIKYNTGGVQQWMAIYDSPGMGIDIASSIGLDKNGNVYITGRSRLDRGGTDNNDYATVKYNTYGVQKWVKRYNGPGISNKGGIDIATAIAVDRDGSVHVTGLMTKNNTGVDYATFKYDKNGERVWKKTYNGPGPDQPCSIALDAKCNVYVTGVSWASESGDDYVTIKYDDDGNTKWVKRYNGPGNGTDQATAIVVDKNGNIYVTGSSEGKGTGEDYTTIKYNDDGNVKWIKRYNGPGNMSDRAIAIAVDKDGNVYVTGSGTGSMTGVDYTTIKYDMYGNELWVSGYNGPGNADDEANGLAVDAWGNVYITGLSRGSQLFNDDYATVKYNSAGIQQWVARYDGPANAFDRATGIDVHSDGSTYVTGQSAGIGTGQDIATIKYNAAGQQQWLARYNSASNYNDFATDLALDAYGNVYISGGGNRGGNSEEYTTIKYSSTGNRQWIAKYAGDVANAIAVDNLNNVYVTGQSYGSGTSYDYATIKYEQTPVLTRSSTEPQQIPPVEERASAKLTAKAVPNAFTEFTNLQWRGSNEPVTITITDAVGRLVEKRTGLASRGTIQTGYRFRPGIYYATIVQGNQKLVTKLVKN